MADQNRRMSEQFGDLEYEYDLLDHLDPIARAGFDPSRVRVGDLDKKGQNTAYYQPVGDIINIGPSQLSSKATHAHEFRERGINILMKEISDDSLAFRKKYGDELYFQLLDLKIAIEAQNRPQMIEDGEYNKNLAEMISEFYEKHESYNKPTGPYVEGEDVPPFSYNRKTRQPNTAAERLALLKAYADERGLPVRQGMRVINPEEQFKILETDNQSAFREYLQTNPADRVEGAFFRGAFRGNDTVKNRPLFESVDLLRQFAEEQNKKRGIRNPEEYFVVKPREQFAQGGPVMSGIGTLNETARNMFRGPRGIGAFQQFAGGGEANRELEDFFNDRSQNEPPPARGLPPTKSPFGDGIRELENLLSKPQGRGKGYFDDVNFRIDSYEIDGKPSYAIEFDDGFSLFEPQIIEMLDENNSANEPIPGERTRKELFRYLFEKNPTSEEFFRYLKTTGLASGGEVSGPPPTRGPDPQGIGYFQQFADGGPVYMSNGGDPNFKLLVQAVQKVESNFDSRAVSEDGAIGLMQILPTTAAQPGYEKYGAENVFDIAERLMGFRDERTVENARALLFDPEINVEFGTKYLQAMIRDSGGDILQALQKYNAGVGNYQAFEEDPEKNPLDQEAVQYPIKVTAAYQNFDPSNPLELSQFSNRPEAASQMMAMYEQPEPELVRPRLRPEFLGDKGVTTSLRPQLRPQGIMSIQDPAVMDRVVEQVQEELPPTQEERDLYEKYSPENMFPDAGLTEGEMIRRERFAPKEGDAEPYRQPPSTLEQIDQFFQRFAPSRKPERVIQPKPTPMQYRSA